MWRSNVKSSHGERTLLTIVIGLAIVFAWALIGFAYVVIRLLWKLGS